MEPLEVSVKMEDPLQVSLLSDSSYKFSLEQDKVVDDNKHNSMTFHNNLLAAAVIIQDGCADVLPLSVPAALNARSRRLHRLLYNNLPFKIVGIIFELVYLLMGLFEMPPWLIGTDLPYGPSSIYQTTELPFLPLWGTYLLEYICVLFFLVEMALHSFMYGHVFFWKRASSVTRLTLLCSNGICLFLAAVRWPRLFFWRGVFRVGTIIFRNRPVRMNILNIFRAMPDILGIFALLLMHITFFAFLGYVLFSSSASPPVRVGFTDLGQSYWSILQLVTANTVPGALLPAYYRSRWYSIYFIVFLVVGIFLIMNVVFAVIYLHYRKQLGDHFKHLIELRNATFDTAFDLLDIEDKGFITNDTFFELCIVLKPAEDKEALTTHMRSLVDVDNDNKITREEFRLMEKAVRLQLQQPPPRVEWWEKLRSDHPGFVKAMEAMANHKIMEWVVNIMILGNAGIVLFEAAADRTTSKQWAVLEGLMNAFFSLEVAIRMLALGPYNFLLSHWAKFDLIVVASSDITLMVVALTSDVPRILVRMVLVVRMLRLLRVVNRSQHFNFLFTTFIRTIPAFSTFLAVELLVLFSFASIGVQTFGGAIYLGNPGLAGTVYASPNYIPLNFNDLPSALMALFILILKADWQIANAFASATGVPWSRVYFVAFWFCCFIILTKLLVSTILRAFLSEFENADDGQSQDMKIIGKDGEVVATVERSKNFVLHRMFK